MHRGPRPLARSVGALFVVLSVLAALAAPGAAQEPEPVSGETEPTALADLPETPQALPPRHRVYYKNLLAARLNPLGLEDRIELGYALRLWDSPSILWRDAFVGIALTPTLSPAVSRLGATLSFKPVAVLLVSASAYWVKWFGTFEYLQSYAWAHAEFSDTALDRGEELGLNYDTQGFEAEFQIQALAKVWQIVLRNDLKFYYDDMSLRGADRLFYNIRIDHLVPDEGWSLTNDTDLVWLSDFGLVAGLRTTVTHAFYRDADFLPTEDPDDTDNTPTVRLGPLVAWIIDDDLHRAFDRPTVLAVVNWWLVHRYRTGEDVEQAIPYFVLGFSFEGELWASQP